MQILTPAEAASWIRDGDTITTAGFLSCGVPDVILKAIHDRFAAQSAPKNLSLIFAAGLGDGEKGGLNWLTAPGLLSRVIGGHWSESRRLGEMALAGEIIGYNLPQGVISHLYRAIGTGDPGVVSHVGLGTFVDPRLEGGKVSPDAPDLVQLIELAGQERLFYPSEPIHVAILRGTAADEDGNITVDREALLLDNLGQAIAAHNSGGKVIVQVESLAARGSFRPRDVLIPAGLVDGIVIAPPGAHPQTYGPNYFCPALAGQQRAPQTGHAPMEMGPRKIIARRAAMELPRGGIVNLGIGMPEGVAMVAAEEGILSEATLTTEPGIFGGEPAGGILFGAGVNPHAVFPQYTQFDFYDGGGLDLAVLGLAEIDAEGDVNVSRFGGKLAGCGGFINITQNAKKLIFAGTFTARGLRLGIGAGGIEIAQEGSQPKFCAKVEQVTFSGAVARAKGQPVLIVTERAVFELRADGLWLAEIAPGINLERDILAQMSFTPKMGELREMDARIFAAAPMGL